MDIFKRYEKTLGELGQYSKLGHQYFIFPKLEGELGPRMKFRGKEVLVWSLNDYLGLGNHPEVRKADADGAAKWGLAYPMGSRMLTGNTDLHEEFERKVADFLGKEDAYLLNFGYQGMVSIIAAIANRKDVIVYDQLAHACILDGMMQTGAKRFVFRHNDMEQFEDRLKKAKRLAEQQGGGIFVITEGVFGMKGDLGNLAEMLKFKDEYGFRILVDDAHGFGVMGKTGAGTGEHFGVMDEIDLYFGTFAKSLAGIGAFVAGNNMIINYLRFNMRSQIYAKSLPMPMVYGGLQRLKMLIEEPKHREQLWTVVNALQTGLRERGFDIGPTESPVTPVRMQGGQNETANLTFDLRENLGIFVSVVTYPVIEKGEMILRIIPTASHSLDDVAQTLDAFETIAGRLKAGVYNAEIKALV